MSQQLIFDLPSKAALGRDDFFISPANSHAVSTIDKWQNWPDRKQVLVGPGGSGKTHLMHVWANEAGARVFDANDLNDSDVGATIGHHRNVAVENVDGIAGRAQNEQALFHLHNTVLAEGGHLLMTGTASPNRWDLKLPDLKSRILGTGAVALNAPDDALLAAVMVKLFADRQLTVAPNMIAYLLGRMIRSFEAVHLLVGALDDAALTQGRAISKPLARQVLDNLWPDSA